MTDLRFTCDANGVATIAWDLAQRPVNLLTEASVTAFGAMVERVLDDECVTGAIVASGKRDFLAGLDLADVVRGRTAQASDLVDTFRALTRRIETGGKPFVAALNGTALGGGAELALACHRRIGADDVPSARFGFPEVTLGLIPGGGGTQRVPRLCGIAKALPLLLEGQPLPFEAAQSLGLIDECVPQDLLLKRAHAWVLAHRDARQPWDVRNFTIPGGPPQSDDIAGLFVTANALLRKETWGNYPATRAVLSAVYEGCQLDIDGGLRVEARYFRRSVASPEARAMVGTLFFALGRAQRSEGRPANVPRAVFAHVAVLGAGMMGAGIAQAAARAGARVTLLDRDLAVAERVAAQAPARIVATTEYAPLADADIAIEAVFEDRAIKADVARLAEKELRPRAILASNTSTLPITGLAQASAHPERFIGLHFFSPVDRMPLVEIIRGRMTSDQTLAIALDFVRFLGKTAIVVNDGRGFFTSRVFSTYVHEGLAMLREGVPPALIENAGRLAGMAVGPLAVADEVSLTLMNHVLVQTRRDLGEAYVPGPADDVIERFATTLDRPGKSAGRGLYAYPVNGKKHLWEGLAAAIAAPTNRLDVEMVRDRLMYAQAIEAMRCLAEGVIEDPAMGDVGSILGWGFPAFTGGVFSYAAYVGEAAFRKRARALAERYGARFAAPL